MQGAQDSCTDLQLSIAHSEVSVGDLPLLSRHCTALLSYVEIFLDSKLTDYVTVLPLLQPMY